MAPPATTDRATRTRGAVLQAAIEVFAAEGFHGADVQVIADRAGVGKGTVYRHFGEKEKLFLAAARHALERLSESVDREVRGGRGVVNYLREIALSCARFAQAHPEIVEVMIQER